MQKGTAEEAERCPRRAELPLLSFPLPAKETAAAAATADVQ